MDPMESRLPTSHTFINTGDSSELSVSSSQNSDPVGNVAKLALSELTKTYTEILKTAPKDRRLSQVLPPLKGDRPFVGRSSITMQVDYPANCDKEIGIEIFAPSRIESGNKVHLGKMEEIFKRIDKMRFDDNQAAIAKDDMSKEKLEALETHSSDHLDSVEAGPIVIFSHGLRENSTVYRPLVEELASHGYIVLNVNHPATSSSGPFSKEELAVRNNWDQLEALAEEEAVKKPKENKILDKIREDIGAIEDHMVDRETNNIRFIIEKIRNGNLNGRLPKDCGSESPIILAGHSLGGEVSMIAARNNPNVTGCINLDGRLAGKSSDERTANLEVPTLLFFLERNKEEKEEIQKFLTNNDKSGSTLEVIKGVEHLDFAIYPIIDWVAGGKRLVQGIYAHNEASKAMVNFIEKLGKK